MVTYGPWTQDPDYAKPAIAHGPPNIESVASAKLATGDSPPPKLDAMSQVIDASREAWGDDDVRVSGVGILALDYDGHYGQPPASVYEVRRSYGLLTFSAYSQNLNAWVPSLPPGAIGYEWESGAPPGAQRSEVVSLTWDMPSTAHDLDGTTGTSTGGTWGTEVRSVVGLEFASQTSQDQAGVDSIVSWDGNTGSGPHVITLPSGASHLSTQVDPVDLTPCMFGPPEAGYAALISEVVLSGPPPMPTLEQVSGLSYTGGWGIGHAYNLSIPAVYTFRPPRYRLIYASPGRRRGAPPLRLTQRGDGRTGGAPRLLGRNSQQSTNRLSGGYF